ncbi:MAG: hypothetical protein ACI8XO_002449 [Verrucomicrobiales bacterium]|jgi:hypothetical protein
MLLILAAILSVAGATLCLGFFVFSSSYADIGGVTRLIIGLGIFSTDSFQ